MGVAITFEKLDQWAVTTAIHEVVEAQRIGEPTDSPFEIVGIFVCPKCAGLSFVRVDGIVATCRICNGHGAITLNLEGAQPPPSSYVDRRNMIRLHLERLKELKL